MEIFDIIRKEQVSTLDKIGQSIKFDFSKHITLKQFQELFKNDLDIQVKASGFNDSFEIDLFNKDLLHELSLWVMDDPKCKYDLRKGFLLLGTYGIGKTVIMKAFCHVQNRLIKGDRNMNIVIKSAHDILKDNINWGTSPANLFIDDIGKEPNIVKDYGTDTRPLAEIFYNRCLKRHFTFCTSNYNMESLTKLYGQSITDRFKQLFNIVILEGKSKR